MNHIEAELPDLYPGFGTEFIDANGVQIYARTGGSGPPLLLLHGYPQTHACWHLIAPELARYFSLVLIDLRGYGQSSAPRGDTEHRHYSKRVMAQDCVAVMRALNHQSFSVLSHDRGARVGYRLALDHPELVDQLVTLDIVPTSDAWDAMDVNGAMSKFHWSFLAQPVPMPETMIGAAADHWHEHLLASWTADQSLDVFDTRALQHYRASFRQPERIHAMSEDYRAGLTVDYQLDREDLAAGRKINCPTQVLWGERRSLGTVSNTLQTWRRWCDKVTGGPVSSGHFLAEENPQDTLKSVIEFLR